MNTESEWVPLTVRMGLREPFKPTTGVPDFMWNGLESWFEEVLDGYGVFDAGLSPLEVGLKLRVAVSNTLDARFELIEAFREDENLALDAVDLLLSLGASADGLRELLCSVDHELTVDADSHRLVTRVSPSTHAMYQSAITEEDHVSALLASAWAKTMSRDSDPSGAWTDATKAVEELLTPIVSPRDSKATIGKMARAIRDAPHKWRCSLHVADGRDPVLAFEQALELVGFAPDRHGGNGSTGVDPLTSRTVVLQAITICDWLRSGVLRQVED